MEIINTLIKFFNSFGVFVLLGIAIIVLWILSIREKNRKEREVYEAIRREEVSRISDGVASGIVRIFNDKSFIQALNNGVSIEVKINVDGSQNIIINGNGNQIQRVWNGINAMISSILDAFDKNNKIINNMSKDIGKIYVFLVIGASISFFAIITSGAQIVKGEIIMSDNKEKVIKPTPQTGTTTPIIPKTRGDKPEQEKK